MANGHTLSREDRALKTLFLETALAVPCAEGQGAYAPFNCLHAFDVLRDHFPDTNSRKRAWSWAKYELARIKREAEQGGQASGRANRIVAERPAMRQGHYVRAASGSRERLIGEIERGEAQAPWAQGKPRTEWGRLIDRSRFPMPRVEFDGRVL